MYRSRLLRWPAYSDARDRDALERLGRTLGRPSVATERLRYEPGGRVTYPLRKPWSDPPVITAILECLHLFPHRVVTDPPHAPP